MQAARLVFCKVYHTHSINPRRQVFCNNIYRIKRGDNIFFLPPISNGFPAKCHNQEIAGKREEEHRDKNNPKLAFHLIPFFYLLRKYAAIKPAANVNMDTTTDRTEMEATPSPIKTATGDATTSPKMPE